ncbi:MAG: hypothetical protein DWQ49_09780 [Bacteroidetes bacterium]|nr:MAG: hypothetical protein DWQ49_09780 [Bacteroidota bacterium]
MDVTRLKVLEKHKLEGVVSAYFINYDYIIGTKQYFMALIHLRPTKNSPKPDKASFKATHELLIVPVKDGMKYEGDVYPDFLNIQSLILHNLQFTCKSDTHAMEIVDRIAEVFRMNGLSPTVEYRDALAYVINKATEQRIWAKYPLNIQQSGK